MTRSLRLAGATAVILSLWLHWYEVRIPDEVRHAFDGQKGQVPQAFADFARGILAAIPTSVTVNGWQAFEGADVALALLAGAVAFSVMLTVDARAIIAAAVAIAGIVLVHVLDQPGPNEIVTVKVGPWVALAGAAAIALSARAEMAPASSSPDPWAPAPAAPGDAWAAPAPASVPPPTP